MKVLKFLTGPIQVNTYLAYDETKKGFIVDPGDYSRQLTEKIQSEEIDIEYIILTHGHGDHIGGVLQYKELFPNSKIVAGSKEKELLENPALNLSAELFGKPLRIFADMYVSEGDSVQVGNTSLSFIDTPGHTVGGICILTKGYVFSGDTLFMSSIGRTDFHGGNFQQLIDSIREKLFVLPDETIVLPGHMDETSIGYEKEHNPFV